MYRRPLFWIWCALIAALAFYVQTHLTIGADLRLFLPAPATRSEQLLLDEVGQGPASRVLLLALSGAEPAVLAAHSSALTAALRADPQFRVVTNGESLDQAITDDLLPYRYLLSSSLDGQTLDAAPLRAQLNARLRDLSSPAGSIIEPWVARDPTLAALALLTSWQGDITPQTVEGVWFNRGGDTALLIAETTAQGFDPEGQQQAIDRLQSALQSVRTDAAVSLTVSGTGAFAALVKGRAQREATFIGSIDGIAMLLLLWVAYRSITSIIQGSLPLVTAGFVGLAAVSALFGTVHGITLAFGFTLIGVAQDYPIHLLSHQRRGISALQSARALWPTLATGVASTCIAYLAFLFSGVAGLAQLACFTIAGLGVAALCTRFALPRLMDAPRVDHADSQRLGRVADAVLGLPHLHWLGLALAAAALAVTVWAPGPFWQNSLSSLTPIPPALLQRDDELRQELGAANARYLGVIEAPTADAVLVRSAQLQGMLTDLQARGVVAGFVDPGRYLPPVATQLERRARLPDADTLRASLRVATRGLPFAAGAFEPFVADVQRARELPPLTAETVASTPIGAAIGGLLVQQRDHWLGLITFNGVNDGVALATALTGAGEGVTFLDLKDASEQLVARERQRILISLALAAVLLVIVVAVTLRQGRRIARVLLPMALATLLILAVLRGAGVALNLFHLIALVLAAGLGLDYALFFEHATHDSRDLRRTLHALLVCSASTMVVFAVLAASSLPVLQGIGVTVTLGVVFNFLLALLFARPPAGTAAKH